MDLILIKINSLSNGSVYYPEVVGISSIKLYDNINDFNAGINTVGFTTINTQGTHIFKTLEKKNSYVQFILRIWF